MIDNNLTTMQVGRHWGDRFIRQRSMSRSRVAEAGSDIYSQLMIRELFGPREQNIFCPSMFSERSKELQKRHPRRSLNPLPLKVLDAPNLRDDYYLNILDWSSKGLLAIGLADQLFLYSEEYAGELCSFEDQYVCSVNFHPQGDCIALGSSDGTTAIYDITTRRLIRTLRGHSDRVSAAAFTYQMLFTGGKDKRIIGHDLRCVESAVKKFNGHRGEICGLAHDCCGLASGSNDNQAMIWDLNSGKVRQQLSGHKGAVKALAWCPWQRNLLATGGGISDKTMRFWDVVTGKSTKIVHTESQVCSLLWNPNEKEILSSHGYSENQLTLWRYPECCQVAELKGHSQRVLHMALAPDNSTVCSASADQTIRLWKVFQGKTKIQEEDQKDRKLLSKFNELR